MKLPYYFFIAFRYLRSKKRHKGISINTLISISGVALGVMALIVVLSVMDGFQEDLVKKIVGVNAHIVVLRYDGGIKDEETIRQKINKVKGVRHSSSFVYGQAVLGFGDKNQGIVVRGIEPELEIKTADVLKNIKEGSLDNLKKNTGVPGIIIGRELSRKLGVFVGDKINMILPIGDVGPLGMIPKIRKFRVVGIFIAGMYEYDAGLAYINIEEAQGFFKFHTDVSGIEINVDDIYKTEEISREIENILPPPHYTRDWRQLNINLFSALKLEKIGMFIILTLIVLVASFNIVSNLIMIVIEKAREIAIIRAMGATSRGIMFVFMIQGLIIGIVGTILGLIGGYAACLVLKVYKFPLPPDVYYLSFLPIKTSLSDFIIVSAAAIIISFLATIYPSWRASKLAPVEPLRYE